jgi:hypothetical protein
LLAGSLLSWFGCGRQPEIRTYDVPRNPDAAASDPGRVEGTPTRMIAAIVPRESEAWFVKITGPEEAVATVADEVRQFIGAIELTADDPNRIEWTRPEAWKDGGERMMREATFLLPGGDLPLEVAISKLGYDGDQDPYLLANLNRWRGQIGLPPGDSLNAMENLTKIDLDGGVAWVFDAVGATAGGGMQPPMMGGSPPFAGATPPVASRPPSQPAKPHLEFDTPPDWQEAGRGSMGSRSYRFGEGDEQVTVKLSDFPPVGSMADPLSNINRWRGQLGQPPLDAESIKQHTEAVEISDTDGVLTTIERPDQSEAMLPVMVVKHDHVWFFQLLGSPQGVAAHREEFLDWLGTVEINDSEAVKEEQ